MTWLIAAWTWTRNRIAWVATACLALALIALAHTRSRLEEKDRQLARAGDWIDTGKRLLKEPQTNDADEATQWLKERQDAPPEH